MPRPSKKKSAAFPERRPVYELGGDGKPKLIESVVIFLDILGYQEMALSARSPEQQHELLARLHKALNRHVPRLIGDAPWYAVNTFTDCIVLGRPIHRSYNEGEMELGMMFLDAAAYQMGLAMEGFFVRGGIAVGPHFMDDHVTFGPALIEAYKLESREAVFPRILISDAAHEYVKTHVSFYAGGAASAPHNGEILVDDDGKWFVNYLDAAPGCDDEEEREEYRLAVGVHRDVVAKQLAAYAENARVLDKYRWVARYHNYVVSYLYPGDDDLCIASPAITPGFKRLEAVLPAKARADR